MYKKTPAGRGYNLQRWDYCRKRSGWLHARTLDRNWRNTAGHQKPLRPVPAQRHCHWIWFQPHHQGQNLRTPEHHKHNNRRPRQDIHWGRCHSRRRHHKRQGRSGVHRQRCRNHGRFMHQRPVCPMRPLGSKDGSQDIRSDNRRSSLQGWRRNQQHSIHRLLKQSSRRIHRQRGHRRMVQPCGWMRCVKP